MHKIASLSQKTSNFYPRDAMLALVFAIVTCPSVRPSVRPSRAGIVSKRRNVMISSPCGSPTILVFWCQISSGSPSWGLKEGWGGKIQRFSSYKRQYLENGSRYGWSYN